VTRLLGLGQVLKQCGDDLTRENVMRQAANLHHLELPMLLPGITINTSPTDFAPIKQVQMERFDGERFIKFGPILGGTVGGPGKGDRSGLHSAVIVGCRLRAEGLA
jgi:branched-chain amino acid transport system substrate-binding protein